VWKVGSRGERVFVEETALAASSTSTTEQPRSEAAHAARVSMFHVAPKVEESEEE
jgi:hypothetical protein